MWEEEERRKKNTSRKVGRKKKKEALYKQVTLKFLAFKAATICRGLESFEGL